MKSNLEQKNIDFWNWHYALHGIFIECKVIREYIQLYANSDLMTRQLFL